LLRFSLNCVVAVVAMRANLKGEVLRQVLTDVANELRDKGVVDRHGLPLSVSTHAANHHEVRLVQLCCERGEELLVAARVRVGFVSSGRARPIPNPLRIAIRAVQGRRLT
jgi:hypothetical protein